MRTKRAVALCGAFVAAMVAASVLAGPRLPETMVTHWGAGGQPNGTMSKFWGQFFVPLLTLGVVAVLFVSPKIDPKRENIEVFRPLYNDFIVLLTAFLAVTHGVALAWNLGYDVPIDTVVFAGVGLLIFYAGVLLDHAQQNWFIGIRTPWTLSDEAVWERTHEIGARLFKLSGILSFLGAFAGEYAVYFAVGPVLVSALALVAYSYFLFERTENDVPPG
ncbi:MAG: SdpI family protein [Halorientalis sp.]